MRFKNAIFPIALLILVSGCRMYGGYGSEEAIYAEIQEMLERVEDRAQRLEGDHAALVAAASGDAMLADDALATGALVDAQTLTLAAHRTTAASVDEGSSYRALSRALGAMITEQQIIEDEYSRIVARLLDRSDLDMDLEARYAVVPAGLARIEANLQDVSIRDALLGR